MKLFIRFWRANDFPVKVIFDYFRYSSRSEKVFDFIIPAILCSIILASLIFNNHEIKDILKGIPSINNQVLTSISILAGFNVASISVLATTNSDLMNRLAKQESQEHPGVTLFYILMSFFCAAITLQFFVIFIGIAILVYSSISNVESILEILTPQLVWAFFYIWIYVIFVSVLVSLRNLKTLFTIIVEEKK
mgnify:CR=1 FL=1